MYNDRINSKLIFITPETISIVRAIPDTLSLKNGSSKKGPPQLPSALGQDTFNGASSTQRVLCKVVYEKRAASGFEYYTIVNPPAYLGTEGPFLNCVFVPVPANTSLDSDGHVLCPYPETRVSRSF